MLVAARPPPSPVCPMPSRTLAGLLIFGPLAGCATPPAPVSRYAPADPPTYVYVIDGADPGEVAGTRRLADRLRAAGYPHTRYGGWFRAAQFERDIRAARAADPAARFALIGFSAGTFAARDAAARLIRDGVPVALVGYVGGDYLSDSPASRVAGAGRVVNVTGDGHPLTGGNLLFNGTDIGGARNVRLAGVGHFDLPTHPDTAAVLLAELAAR